MNYLLKKLHNDLGFVVPKAVLIAGTALALLGIYAGVWNLALTGFVLFPVSLLLWVLENWIRHPIGEPAI